MDYYNYVKKRNKCKQIARWFKNSALWWGEGPWDVLRASAIIRRIIFENNWLMTLQQARRWVGGAEHCVTIQGKMVH